MLPDNVLRSLAFAVLLAFSIWAFKFCRKWDRHRKSYQSLPGPPHSYWLGHLKVLDEAMKELPPNMHMQMVVTYIAHKYDLKEAFYLDMWPASRPFMIVMDPGIATQLTVTSNTPKHAANREFLGEMTGAKSVITMEGQPWKQVRSVLMSTYAPSYLLSLVPVMSKHISIMCDIFEAISNQNQVVEISEYTTNLTIDIIGDVTLGMNLNAQKSPHPIAYYFKKATRVCSDTMGNPLAGYTYGIPMWWYTRNITKQIEEVVEKRYSDGAHAHDGSRLTIDLAIAASRTASGDDANAKTSPTMDREWLKIAIDNIKTLLLGGHDTTAATISYMLCLLSTHPEVMARLRQEHDNIIHPSLSRAEAIATLSDNATVLNTLVYTNAVIKETLRLYPTSSTTRTTTPTHPLQYVELPSEPGKKLPLALSDQIIWVLHFPIHHRADLFPDPYEFIPERFIPDSAYAKDHPLPKEAWRPFERGPRACMGMELTMVEMKLAILLLLREFQFEPAYAKDAPRAPECLGGEQWYQVMEFAAKPVGGMPMKVYRRNK